MTGSSPGLLFDTCSVINLSYSPTIAGMFKARYDGRAGWTRATRTELTRQGSKRPPHPQAGRANRWGATWLGSPLEILDPADQAEVAQIQDQIALRSTDGTLDHLGEASSIFLLHEAGSGRLVSDDHDARHVARAKYDVKAISTVGVVAQLLSRQIVHVADVDAYLDLLRANGRMRLPLTAAHLQAGNLMSWQ